jgi:hypothetical protein
MPAAGPSPPPEAVSRSSENPFASPTSTSQSPPLIANASNPKEPFSHQAAKFSAYAPFILFLMGMCLQGQVAAHRETETGMQLGMALAGISICTALAAFVFGFIGLAGGIMRRSGWTIVLALVGILLNGGLLSLWTFAILAILNRQA